MTVQELIDKLSTHDKTKRVIVRGYEGGYRDATNMVKKPIKINVNTEWYYGAHAEPETHDGEIEDEVAILIS